MRPQVLPYIILKQHQNGRILSSISIGKPVSCALITDKKILFYVIYI